MDKEKLKLAIEEGLLLKQEKEKLQTSKEKKRKEKEEREKEKIISAAKAKAELIISELNLSLKEAIGCSKNEIPLFCLGDDYNSLDEKDLYKTKVKEFLDEELSKLNIKSFVRPHLEWGDVSSKYPRYCSRDDICISVSDLIQSVNDE